MFKKVINKCYNDDRVYKGISSAPSTATYYLRDAGGKELATLNISSNAWIYYAYGRERVAEFGSRAVSYYNYDHLGSVRVMYQTDNTCEPTAVNYTPLSANDYMAFGKTLRSFNNTGKYAYQGSEKDKEFGDNDYYTHYRNFETDAPHFRSPDPKFKPEESPYVSMGDNPVMNIDPLGDDWFVNKETGNVVFLKGQSTMNNKQYGSEQKWENLGKDNMFDKNGQEYSKNHALMFMEAKCAEIFMNKQGYEKGDKMVVEQVTWTDKSPDGDIGSYITTHTVDKDIKILSDDITYVTPDKFNNEVVLNTKTEKMTKGALDGVLKKTTDQISVIRKSSDKQGGSSSGSDAYVGILKFAGKKMIEGLAKFLKKK